jgi:hypothetical protein
LGGTGRHNPSRSKQVFNIYKRTQEQLKEAEAELGKTKKIVKATQNLRAKLNSSKV